MRMGCHGDVISTSTCANTKQMPLGHGGTAKDRLACTRYAGSERNGPNGPSVGTEPVTTCESIYAALNGRM